ncbi:trypsin-like peptidase domain-containing protein [Streptomyces sp. NBC_00727]|uniref:trypsin-like peptidase domain-containing protein n=1 Tax=Streptomyces sp. NBC_00727 TaxID=2903675 RepID=UPI00386F0A87
MDDGKPTGPKAKWWSRPTAGPATAGEAPEPAPAPPAVPAQAPVSAEAPMPTEPPATPGAPDPHDAAMTPGARDAAVTPDGPGARDAAVTPSGHDAPAPHGAPAPHDAPAVLDAPHGAPAVLDAPHGVPATKPLHEPDPYGTPPYGGPGPWAPAPPVQRPTPAHGTPVPPPYAGTDGAGVSVVPPPAPQPQDAHPPAPQWQSYDPWGAPRQPLVTQPGPPLPDGRRKNRRGTMLVGALLLALVAGGIGGGIGAYMERNGGLTSVELAQDERDGGGRAPDSVAGIAASALPSVVTLHVSGATESGTGTGFVLDDRGHILTNNHVVAPAGSSGEITVTFSGGETATAEVVGKDSGYDLAVVKVSGVSGLKPLPLGNSDNVQVGDPVVAIGAPFDLSNTVTSGIISAKDRPITAGGEKGDGSDVSYVNALQTDAPINPGNSGGPLVDTDAHVIGINSAIRAADSGSAGEGGQAGSIGLGFAIPINQGKFVAEELINTGKATHPVIGVTLDMKYTGDGAKVGATARGASPVTADGPADKAGIEPDDIITEVDGKRVHSGEELIVKIRSHRPGDRLELTVARGGKDLSITLTLGSATGT